MGLKAWNKARNESHQRVVSRLKEEYKELKSMEPTDDKLRKTEALCKELNIAMQKEELYWLQQAKPSHIEDIMEAVECKVTTEMNAQQVAEFKDEEVRAAIKHMHPTKAPSPVACQPFSTKSFETLWDLIENKSAFIPRRLIIDIVFTAYEIIYKLKMKSKGKEGFITLKLNMSKAYNRVKWSFLEAMMYQLGFHPRFIDLIMQCITSMPYSMVLNGDVSDRFPTKGVMPG
ncbi:uncharacterized protein LOC111303277 [Durio zibethinus]|uniref:Uncharacterized protein LOC111303277 n=1 Tax=Durio zibethinus TaxID=66656 RepID=A0A6P5ZRI9_DURZI|nr:uncharacterized protein LOC111303277 [Durio zibethinus]